MTRFLNTVFCVMFLLNTLASMCHSLKIGAVTYWDNPSDYTNLPANCLAIINPNDGIIKATRDDIVENRNIINNIKRAVPSCKLLGYVPTGYGDRSKEPFARIKSQVTSYFANFPQLDGIFFDEIGNTCGRVKSDLPQLRSYVNAAKLNSLVAYNPGTVGDNGCFLNYVNRGEIIMDFESPFNDYKSNEVKNELNAAKTVARNRGVLTWHAIYAATSTSDMQTAVNMAKQFGADYIYVTNFDVDQAYSNPPSYWRSEMQYVASV